MSKIYTSNRDKQLLLAAHVALWTLWYLSSFRALADILRQQGPIPIAHCERETISAIDTSPKDNTPIRTSSKNHYTPVRTSKSNPGKRCTSSDNVGPVSDVLWEMGQGVVIECCVLCPGKKRQKRPALQVILLEMQWLLLKGVVILCRLSVSYFNVLCR